MKQTDQATQAEPTALHQMKSLMALSEEAAGLLRDMAPRAVEPDRSAVRAPSVEDYSGRVGYRARFLPGFSIALPKLGAARAGDVVPRLDGAGSVLTYEHVSIVMSASRRLAYYVACNIDGAQAQRIERTGDPWRLDPRIDARFQCGNELYRDNELDRGHLVRREDPVWGGTEAEADRAERDTFHYTNCAPQVGRFNQTLWLGLEDYILQHARAEPLRLSVFTGPAFREDDREYRGVKLPREYWKVVAVVTEGRRSATAYLLSQESLLDNVRGFAFGPYKTYQVGVAEVEQRTGLTFGTVRRYDGFTTEGRRTLRPLRVEVRSWEDIRI